MRVLKNETVIAKEVLDGQAEREALTISCRMSGFLTPAGGVVIVKPVNATGCGRGSEDRVSVEQGLVEQVILRRHRVVLAASGGARAWWGYWFTPPGEVRLPA